MITFAAEEMLETKHKMPKTSHASPCGRAWLAAVVALVTLAAPTAHADALDVTVAFLGREAEARGFEAETPPLPPKGGLEGARLGLKDVAATGAFLKQTWHLDETVVPLGDDFAAAVKARLDAGRKFLVVEGSAEDVAAAAALAEKAGALVFNSGAPDVRLRQADCRANLFHTLPSRDMLTDALAEYLVKKRWRRLMLVRGPGAGDALHAEAMKASARKFALEVVADKVWADPTDGRTVAQEVPLLTQGPDHDVVIVADETADFGRAFPYATWAARPVMGTSGLVATGWNDRLRGWGAAQIQDRFVKTFGRAMDDHDYAAWIALRAIAEGATRAKSAEPEKIAAALVAPDFVLGGFKGAKASFRPWNRQMRQPIALTHGEGVAAFAPIEGFAHRVTELDTLGVDEPESKCPFPSPKR